MWERNDPFKLEACCFLPGSCLEVHLWGPMVTLEGGWKELGTLFGAFQSYKARTCKAQYEPGKNNCSLASQKKILSVGRAATLKHAFHSHIKKWEICGAILGSLLNWKESSETLACLLPPHLNELPPLVNISPKGTSGPNYLAYVPFHYYPKPTVGIQAYSGGRIAYGSNQCAMTCIPRYRKVQNNFAALNVLHYWLSIPASLTSSLNVQRLTDYSLFRLASFPQ